MSPGVAALNRFLRDNADERGLAELDRLRQENENLRILLERTKRQLVLALERIAKIYTPPAAGTPVEQPAIGKGGDSHAL